MTFFDYANVHPWVACLFLVYVSLVFLGAIAEIGKGLRR